MNTKTLRTRPIGVLALVLLIAMPTLLAKITITNATATTPVISLFQSGSTNATIQIYHAFQSYIPLNGSVSLDIYLNNSPAGNIWGWDVGVTWDPTVLQLETVTEGPYLNGNGQTLFITGYINNTGGTTPQGIGDVYLTNMTTNAAAGVLATLTFQVMKYGNCTVNLTAGTPTLEDNFHSPIACALQGATLISYTIPGDFRLDGKVDLGDLTTLALAWHSQPGSPNWNPAADLNHDGVVDLADLVTLGMYYGQQYP